MEHEDKDIEAAFEEDEALVKKVAERWLRTSAPVWTFRMVLAALTRAGLKGYTSPDRGDHRRISDLGSMNPARAIAEAVRSAKGLVDPFKALRRGVAAEKYGPNLPASIAQVYYSRAMEIVGKGTMIVPPASASRPTRTWSDEDLGGAF